MLTLDDYLLSCGGGGGRVGNGGSRRVGCGGSGGVGGGRVGDGDSSSYRCRWLWLLFIVVDILFYYNVYIILLCWKLK